jgi:hypothetical protein
MKTLRIIPLFLAAAGTCPGDLPRVSEDLFNFGAPRIGLPVIAAEHQTIYFAADEAFRFCHQPNLAVFNDELHLMWTNGIHNENDPGQRVLWTKSGDGVNWDDWSVLAQPPDGLDGPRFAVATGWYSNDDRLIGYYATIVHHESRFREACIHAVERTASGDWLDRGKVFDGYSIEGPRNISPARMLMTGQVFPVPEHLEQPPPRVLMNDTGNPLGDWQDSHLPPFGEFEERFPEGNWYRAANGNLVLLLRVPPRIPLLYASISVDEGESWSAPKPTNIPTATSRMATGNLPDGRAYCIWNPGGPWRRNPLVIALSEDGVLFDRAWVVRGERTRQRFSGLRKSDGWQYPHAVVWNDALWITYSVNKEDIALSRIALSSMK